MKIALITKMFPPRWLAGSEIAAYNIARSLAVHGNDVHVVTSMDKGLPEESVEEGFHIHRLKYPKIGLLLSTAFFSLAALQTLRNINPEVVHVQGIYYGLAAYLLKKTRGKPYVIYFQGSGLYMPYAGIGPILKILVRNATEVIVLTEHMRITVGVKYKRYATVIPNGVDINRFTALSRKAARTGLNIGETKQIIIFVGSLIPVKGVKYLVEAMSILTQHLPEARLLVVGNGEEETKLKQQVAQLNLESHVTFAGKVPNERIPEFMTASDIFVLPSLSEGFPVTVLEAMAAGLPIVTTNVRGLPEIVRDGENGFLVPSGDSDALAQKLLILLSNNETRKLMSVNNKNKASDYSWDSVASKLEEVYSRIGWFGAK